ncbi:MAG: hypothetical protein QNJ26_20675 [Desulfobacterales bacterium]|nr:hypothetical protein [Desulfobacterales bacterium]
MTLPMLNFWEILLDVTQIGLCGLIIVFLILNRVKFKQLILRAPSYQQSTHINAEFVLEAIRQQTELAFNHILETIDKERQTLDAYYQQSDKRLASGLLTPISNPAQDQPTGSEAQGMDPANVIYNEIENLADKGLSLTDISERLNVPEGEVDLVLKLKHLSRGSDKQKNQPPV